MGDPIIDTEIKKYLDKEISIKTGELKKKVQNLTTVVDNQQKVIETIQKKAKRYENIFNKCLCNNCKNKLSCEIKPP